MPEVHSESQACRPRLTSLAAIRYTPGGRRTGAVEEVLAMRTAFSLLAVVIVALAATLAHAVEPLPKEMACRTPRAAMRTLLDWIQPERTVPEHAAWCLDARGLANPEVAPERALQLKRTLDLKGLWVALDGIPNDPSYVDGDSKKARYVFFSALPPLRQADGSACGARAAASDPPDPGRAHGGLWQAALNLADHLLAAGVQRSGRRAAVRSGGPEPA